MYGDHHKATIILGLLRDKDIPAVCRALVPIAARFLTVPVRSPRTTSPEELGAALALVAPDLPPALPLPGLDAATTMAAQRFPAEPILVTGSFFLVGEALARLTGQPAPEESWQ